MCGHKMHAIGVPPAPAHKTVSREMARQREKYQKKNRTAWERMYIQDPITQD